MSTPLAALLQELADAERHDPRSDLVRLAVRMRARDACEYCLLPTFGAFHVDHIFPASRWSEYRAGQLPASYDALGRSGPDHIENYAWSCAFCNLAKGQAVTARIGNRVQRIYDPRRDVWPQHFALAHQYLLVVGVSAIGRATLRLLQMNDSRLDGPLGTRHEAILAHQYPPAWARSWNIGR